MFSHLAFTKGPSALKSLIDSYIGSNRPSVHQEFDLFILNECKRNADFDLINNPGLRTGFPFLLMGN